MPCLWFEGLDTCVPKVVPSHFVSISFSGDKFFGFCHVEFDRIGLKERQFVRVGEKIDVLHEFFEILCHVLMSD